MKRPVLFAMFYLFAGLCHATFEIEDPAVPGKEIIEPGTGKYFFQKKTTDKEVIVPAATDMYLPNIEQGKCDGWRPDETEIYLDDNNQPKFATSKTYLGKSIKTVECHDQTTGDSLRVSLIQIDQDRLIWVKTDKTLSAN